MACERGCEGTPICNALDLCCIQFLQDCGKECVGVPDGYSTIQFNDLGEMVICSNVGGVCTCESPAVGTDALVDNGDGTYTHTALDTVDTTIDICAALGVIDTNCLNLTIVPTGTGCAIQVDPIIDPDICNAFECRDDGFYTPSIHIVSANADSADFVILNPPLGPSLTPNQLPMQLIVQNPTDCCEMDVKIDFSGYMVYSSSNPGAHVHQIDGNNNFTLDGGPLINPASHNSAHVHQSTDPAGQYGYDLATQGYTGVTTIPAAGNITLDAWVDFDVIINTGSGIQVAFIEQAHISAFGICVSA